MKKSQMIARNEQDNNKAAVEAVLATVICNYYHALLDPLIKSKISNG